MKIPQTIIDIQWAFISIAISSFIHFIIRIFIGKDLGVDGLGLYTLVFTIYLFGMQFANFGIGSAITKYVAEDKDDTIKVNMYISKGLISSVIVGILISILLFILSPIISANIFHNSNMELLLKITAFCFPFIAIQKAVLGALNGLRKMKYFALINITNNIITIITTIILVKIFSYGINGAVIGFVAPTIVVGIISLLMIKKYFIFPPKIFDDTFKVITSFGFFVMIGNSISMLNTQINTILIGYYLDTVEVGYFAISTTIIQGMVLIPQSIQTISGPSFSRLYRKNDIDSLKLLARRCAIYTVGVMLIPAILLILIGNQLILFLFNNDNELIFTNQNSPAYLPLVILVLGYLCYSLFISIGTLYANIGKVKLSFKLNLVSAIISIILNLLLIPMYGIIGAAIATTTSLIVTTIMNIIVIKILFRNIST